jgi:hypothetical protein
MSGEVVFKVSEMSRAKPHAHHLQAIVACRALSRDRS